MYSILIHNIKSYILKILGGNWGSYDDYSSNSNASGTGGGIPPHQPDPVAASVIVGSKEAIASHNDEADRAKNNVKLPPFKEDLRSLENNEQANNNVMGAYVHPKTPQTNSQPAHNSEMVADVQTEITETNNQRDEKAAFLEQYKNEFLDTTSNLAIYDFKNYLQDREVYKEKCVDYCEKRKKY